MEKKICENYEYLNEKIQEISNSPEYILGVNIKKIIKMIKSRHFLQILKFFYRKVITHNLKGINQYTEIKKNQNKDTSSFKIAVYTCITGNYDNLLDPLFKETNCDYFLLTNNKNINSNFWKIIYLDEDINDNVLLNRYAKFHPQKYFDEYDFSIYIDGNIQIISNISEFIIPTINSYAGISMHVHSTRNCVYDEMKICKVYGKGNVTAIKKLYKKYKDIGYQKNKGLFECNVIVTDLKSKVANTVLSEWWDVFYKSNCKRDQILLPYVMFKNHLEITSFGILGNNVNRNNKIMICKHNK